MEFVTQENRIYLPGPDGAALAEVVFRRAADGIPVISRTFVDESLRGRGVAAALMLAAAKTLRARGERTRAACSYAQTWFARHPEYADVLLTAEPGGNGA